MQSFYLSSAKGPQSIGWGLKNTSEITGCKRNTPFTKLWLKNTVTKYIFADNSSKEEFINQMRDMNIQTNKMQYISGIVSLEIFERLQFSSLYELVYKCFKVNANELNNNDFRHGF